MSYKGDGGHSGDFCNDAVWTDQEWEDPGCQVCGLPSDGFRLCGRCLTNEQRMIEEDYWARKSAVFSDDVQPGQQ